MLDPAISVASASDTRVLCLSPLKDCACQQHICMICKYSATTHRACCDFMHTRLLQLMALRCCFIHQAELAQVDSRAEVAVLSRSITIQGPAGALSVTGPASSLTLSNVQLRGLGTFGQPQAAALEISGTVLSSTVQNCTVHSSTAAGLAVVNASNVAISDSTFSGSVGSSVIVHNATSCR